MSLSDLPDNNVWVALAFSAHPGHARAKAWFDGSKERVCFCRMTQLGLLRHLTQQAIMGSSVLTQREAWGLYDELIVDSRMIFLDEPLGIDTNFRRCSSGDEVSPKRWADDYLLAFAEAANLSLITFDRSLAGRTSSSILLAL